MLKMDSCPYYSHQEIVNTQPSRPSNNLFKSTMKMDLAYLRVENFLFHAPTFIYYAYLK